MKKKLRTRLAGVRSAFPAAFSPYWHVLPLGRMKTLLAGYFFIGAAGGFAFDLLQLNASRVGGGFFWPVLVGMGATALRTAGIKRVRLIPLLFLLVVVTAWLGYWASHVSPPLPVPVAVHRRVLFDAIGILVGIGFGTLTLLKRQPVLPSPAGEEYRPEDYVQYREWATAADGTRVPISLVCPRGTKRDGTAPCLLYGYGSYEN